MVLHGHRMDKKRRIRIRFMVFIFSMIRWVIWESEINPLFSSGLEKISCRDKCIDSQIRVCCISAPEFFRNNHELRWYRTPVP